MIRRLNTDEWETYRDVRLAALREAPYAFGSTYEAEVDASEDRWRRAVEERVRLVAELKGQVVGIVGAGAGDLSGTAVLTSLWVDPRSRGKGVGDALVVAVLDWARTKSFGQVLLWVAEGNGNAERLYERHGFARTGAVSAVRPGEPRLEYEMSLRI